MDFKRRWWYNKFISVAIEHDPEISKKPQSSYWYADFVHFDVTQQICEEIRDQIHRQLQLELAK